MKRYAIISFGGKIKVYEILAYEYGKASVCITYRVNGKETKLSASMLNVIITTDEELVKEFM